MDRLREDGSISVPMSKAKSVVMTVNGVRRSRERFEEQENLIFGRCEPLDDAKRVATGNRTGVAL